MKKISALIIAWALSFADLACAESFVTNFDNYKKASTLSGQFGGTDTAWATNNTAPGPDGIPDTADDYGQTDFSGYLLGYSEMLSDVWGLIGGAPVQRPEHQPVVDIAYLFRPIVAGSAQSVDFSVRFGVFPGAPTSAVPIPVRDTFGWAFRDGSGNLLLRVTFVPSNTQSSLLVVRVFDALNQELSGSGAKAISYNAKYDLHVSVTETNLASVFIGDSAGTAPVSIIDRQLVSSALPFAALVHDVAAFWALANTTANGLGQRTGYGTNSMVFNNYALLMNDSYSSGTYANWSMGTFASSPTSDASVGGDPDQDGSSNRFEYAFSKNPLTPDGTALTMTRTGGQWLVNFPWSAHAGDLSYRLYGRADLASGSWAPMNAQVTSQGFDGQAWRVTLQPLLSNGSAITSSRYFFRLMVNQTSLP